MHLGVILLIVLRLWLSGGDSLPEELIHDFGVCFLMSGLIPSDCRADFPELLVSVQAGMSCSISVGDFGGTFLERCVDEAQVGVVVCFGVHA